MTDDLLVDPEALREQVRDKYREVAARPARRASTSTPGGRSPPASATTPPSSTRCPTGPSSPSPASATRSRCGGSQPGERVVDVGSGAGFDSFIAAGQVGPAGRVVGVDMTPEMLTKSRDTAERARLRPRRVPRGPRRGAARRGRLGRRGDLQRCHQPLRRQAGRVRRDPPGAAPRRVAAVRRHRQRPSRAARGAARHRPVDRLNRRRAAPCGLAEDARRHRLRRRRDRDRRSTPSAAPAARTRPGRSRCTATRSSPAGHEASGGRPTSAADGGNSRQTLVPRTELSGL